MRADGQLYDYSKPVWPTDGKNHFETNCTIDALISGVRYHFVARAYKGTAESGDSNEVSYIGFDPVKPIGIKKQKEENNMFLISDAQSKDSVDYFEVEIDGAVIRSDAQVDGDQARLHHELTGLSMGEHTVRVSAVNGWGKSEWTDPFGFVAQLPGPVSGLGLSAE